MAGHLAGDLAGEERPFTVLAKSLGEVADSQASGFRRSTAAAITCHAVAGFIAAFAAAAYHPLKEQTAGGKAVYPWAYWFFAALALVELALVAWGVFVEIRTGRRKERQTWLNCRFASELLRGIKAANPFLDPLFPEVRRHSHRWERFATTCALVMRTECKAVDPADAEALRAARDSYLENRVVHQRKYFTDKGDGAQRPSKMFKALAHWAGPVALVVVGIAFAAKFVLALTHGDGATAFLKNPVLNTVAFLFLPIFVPLLASLSASFLTAFDFGRRAGRYREMCEALGESERWLAHLHTLPNIQATVRRTEEILLDENIEWLAAQKSGFGH